MHLYLLKEAGMIGLAVVEVRKQSPRVDGSIPDAQLKKLLEDGNQQSLTLFQMEPKERWPQKTHR
jgi:hypothetical protein